MVNIVDAYRGRKFDEEMTMIRDKFEGDEGLAKKLRTSITDGLEGNDISKRDKHFGSNERDPPERSGFWTLYFEALDDLMLKILIVCAIVSTTISMIFEKENRSIAWIEGAAIMFAVLTVSGVTAWNDYKKEEQFIKLTAFNEAKNIVAVLRKGKVTAINVNDLKVGDLVEIKPGMNIPCDAILLRGSGVTTDESAMTGESIELKKGNLEMCYQRLEEHEQDEDSERNEHTLPSPVLVSGTQIQTGEGWFMIIVVGKNSCVGKIMSKLNQEIEMTPLQEKLEQIANDIGLLGTYAAAITVIVLFIRFFIEQGMIGYNWGENIGTYLEQWFRYLIVGITIIVVAVPEGLPLAVIISLAYSVRKMLADMNFVKRLAACEIMGGANNICSDKTGTLTKNMMTVTNIYQGQDIIIDVENPLIKPRSLITKEKACNLFIQACACNTTGEIGKTNATEEAILKLLNQFQVDFHKMRAEHLPEQFVRFQFTSKRKKMSTVVEKISDSETKYPKRLHVKGAAEIVLKLCNRYIDEHGDTVKLTDEKREWIINTVITTYAENALRTICFAYKDLKEGEGGHTHEDDADDGVNKAVEMGGDLICIAIIGIRDVIRPEVPDAVDICQKAGIKVRMVTGDNKVTALAIAKQCNIIAHDHEDAILEGPDFYRRVGGLKCANCDMDTPCRCPDDEVKEVVKNLPEFTKIYNNLNVLARSRPEDKYLLVTGIKQMGDTVAKQVMNQRCSCFKES